MADFSDGYTKIIIVFIKTGSDRYNLRAAVPLARSTDTLFEGLTKPFSIEGIILTLFFLRTELLSFDFAPITVKFDSTGLCTSLFCLDLGYLC